MAVTQLGGRALSYPITVTNCQTRVLEQGQGSSAVLFLHGVGARADRWRQNLAACSAAGLHAYATDFPGHGFASKGSAVKHSVSAYASFVIDLMDELELAEVSLVGTSLGGHVAAEVSRRESQRVTALVLVGPTGIEPVGVRARESIAAALTETSLEGIRRKLRTLVYDEQMVTEDWVAEEFRINNSAGAAESFRGLSDYFRNDIDDDAIHDALARERPDLPCLLAWGAKDVMVPATLAQGVLADLPAESQYVEIADSAHAPYLEQPEAFNDALLHFLNVNKAGTKGSDR
jgi:pimeloyl-ACP methyl ester carboxylesterase